MTPKEKIIEELLKSKANIKPVWVIYAEVDADGYLWFAYTFSENAQKEQLKNGDCSLVEDVYDELICKSEDMYVEAVDYISLRSDEA